MDLSVIACPKVAGGNYQCQKCNHRVTVSEKQIKHMGLAPHIVKVACFECLEGVLIENGGGLSTTEIVDLTPP